MSTHASYTMYFAEMDQGKDSIHQELARLFSQAQDRLEAMGKGSFLG